MAKNSYRLLIGSHVQEEPLLDEDGKPRKNDKGELLTRTVSYQAGENEIVEAESNLELRFGSDKFRKLDANDDEELHKRLQSQRDKADKDLEKSKGGKQEEHYEDMTIDQLRGTAAELEVDISHCRNKHDIINALRGKSR